MKKIISLLIIISLFAISWMNTTMADFVVDTNSEMSIQMDDSSTMMKGCNTIDHSCCVSPFKESSNIQATIIQNKADKKIKILDFSFLAILNEKAKEIYLNRFIPPPEKSLFIEKTNTYTALTGIIKNNC